MNLVGSIHTRHTVGFKPGSPEPVLFPNCPVARRTGTRVAVSLFLTPPPFPERPWLGASLSLLYPSNYLSQTRERQDRPHMASSKHGHGLPRQCFWSRRVPSTFSEAAKPSVTTVRRCYLQQALWPRRFKHTMGALAREYTAPKRCVALHMKTSLLR